MPKVVLDTNIFIGVLLASQNCRAIRDAFLDGLFDVVISEELMAELLETIRKPRLAKLFKARDVRELLELLQADAEWVITRTRLSVARDPDDNVVLECAVDGQADAIVTGDDDLLCLKTFRRISILTPRQFLNTLRTSE
jgi:putative PIN family toxin of toxin-antitoxin system